MDIQATKIELAKQLLETENPSLIEDIKKVFAKYLTKKDFWDELSNDQKASIERGLDDVENDRTVSWDSIKEKHKWA